MMYFEKEKKSIIISYLQKSNSIRYLKLIHLEIINNKKIRLNNAIHNLGPLNRKKKNISIITITVRWYGVIHGQNNYLHINWQILPSLKKFW